MKKILIIEDEKIIALDIKATLAEAGYNVIGICNGTQDIVKECRLKQVEIILCDIYLKGNKNGIELMHDIQKNKYIPVVFITAYSTNEVIKDLNKIKNDGYIVKPFTDDQLLATIKLIVEKYYKADNPTNLTEKEKQIIFHLINGLTNNEIAEQINISPHTVRTHRKNIYSKLNVHNVSQMAVQISKMNVFKYLVYI